MSVNEKMTAIAEAIRGKTGKSDTLTLDQMPLEIAGIEAGGGSSVEEYEIVTANWSAAGSGIPSPVVLSESDNFVLYLNSSTTDTGSLVGVLTQTNVGGRTISMMYQYINASSNANLAKSVNADGTKIVNGTSTSIGFPRGTWKLLVWR